MPRRLTAALGFALLAAPLPAAAQSAPEGWTAEATVYLWLTSIDSDVSFPGGTQSVSVSAGDVIGHLDFAVMGRAAIHKGRVGFVTDLVYAKLDGGKDGLSEFTVGNTEIPADVEAEVGLDVKNLILTLAGTYKLVDAPKLKLSLAAGTRFLDMRQDLDYKLTGNVGAIPPQDREGGRTFSLANWDFIAGVSGQYRFGKDQKWFIPFVFDVGTGESDLTWQVLSGVGHSFDWGDVTLAYRRISWDLSGAAENLTLSGPALGATFRF